MSQKKRNVQLHFHVSEQELNLIKEHMKLIGVKNLSAYLRKMAVDGYIIHLDMSEIKELIRLLRICSNNLNQYAKRANETGSIYGDDIENIKERLEEIWDAVNVLIKGLANIP